jgi:hypothetical protein
LPADRRPDLSGRTANPCAPFRATIASARRRTSGRIEEFALPCNG